MIQRYSVERNGGNESTGRIWKEVTIAEISLRDQREMSHQ